jgi:cation/acetate symporter
MATAADWMSAASFISMAGLIAFNGYGASVFLMGWTGGYVLLALLLAPYLRKFGKFTVPEFIGDRYYSNRAHRRGHLPDPGLGHLRHRPDEGHRRGLLALPRVELRHGPLHRHGHRVRLRRARRHEGHHLHADRAVLRADPGLHHPGIFISLQLTGNPIPQLGLGGSYRCPADGTDTAAGKLDQVVTDLGFKEYTTQVMGPR